MNVAIFNKEVAIGRSNVDLVVLNHVTILGVNSLEQSFFLMALLVGCINSGYLAVNTYRVLGCEGQQILPQANSEVDYERVALGLQRLLPKRQ